MSYQRLSLTFDGPVAVLTLHHPEVMNAIGAQMLGELQRAVAEVADPARGARCLLITGAGKAFCTGANLTEIGRASCRERVCT